ncbi:GPI ethanolamine phosphate transferase 1 [Phytophthora cactorum]|uniref:GPI ethanolamine phosphate transferase 1 n=1 Tax=Phytophthora cactorum TaxID=29920 RepID=A0A329SQ27_9STRA|nr:GPI ethanolamine phosphate transferase 1 [Phytophthora cactorum]KAG2839057.1 GPI ethanolamine phosphate transferase 1 [Phytophthora cactorum]KAG2840918.1 GPI ethanolamine phosphate transferase 1 [Phytophthora cactorum]KAG2864922.1 GPI ethanolamine phosphate transferase 1 [Phytophthora cactorum]KAG2924018.1 GPI ethanolamine phosphate transferase 1 [Phytophthora cactorum]
MGSSIVRLLLLGVAFHALCIISIFDIYFQSTVESSIHSANYTSSPPAKRVIIFTFDGCRVDKLFKVVAGYADQHDLNPDSTTNTTKISSDSRVPFLGDVMRNRGSWGVSHNHAPTESRPCHVALTAGMYEDPHAVSNSWKRHPVPFDSVFNQSNNAFIFGNKDVAPILAAHAPQAVEKHYSAREEVEMAREDTTLLDVWAYRRVKELFAKGTEAKDPELYSKLHDEKLVIYCHFLGTDLTGPKYGADSKEYLENIAVVDDLIEKTHKIIEEYYGNDGRTAYVVNADHGMDLRGDHGDDAPAKTRTAIIAWGAGIQGPETAKKTDKNEFDVELPTRSTAEVQARLEAQEHEEQVAVREWGAVLGFKRKDVMQTDVAALISALAGLPYPRNSVGVLPFTYLPKDKYRANAMRANAQQLYHHVLRKEEVMRAHRGLLFVPYSPLHHRVPDLEAHIDEAINSLSEGKSHAIHDDAHRVVEILSQEMIDICRNAIVYYQTYDWLFLRGSIVLGYIGWALVMTVAYLHPQKFRLRWLLTHTFDVKFVATVAGVIWWRFLADSPSTYYLYGFCPLLFWKFVWSHRNQLQAALPFRKSFGWKWSVQAALIFFCLELVVVGYKRRAAFCLLFVFLALQRNGKLLQSRGSVQLKDRLHYRNLMTPNFWWSASCLFIAIFPCLPTEYDENTHLVHFGALLVLLFTCAVVRNLSVIHDQPTQWKQVISSGGPPVLLAMLTLQWTSAYLDSKTTPPFFLVVLNWMLVIVPVTWLLVQTKCQSPKAELSSFNLENEGDLERQQTGEVTRVVVVRLMKIILALAPGFILLSTSYEVLFYLALSSGLVSWVMVEAEQISTRGVSTSREVRRALMLLLFVQVSFLGTTSVASLTSFQIPSTRRFLTEPAPSIAQALVVLKLLIPFVLVACAFRVSLLLPSGAVSTREKELRGNSLWVSSYVLLAVALADILAVQFLFLVNNEGSWKQMGNSIAEFCIVNSQIVLLPTILILAWIFVHDLEAIGRGYELVEEDEDEKDH